MISELEDRIFWEVSYEDLKKKLQLFLEEKQITFIQHHQTFMSVAAAALGGGGESSGQKASELKPPATAGEARAQIAGLLL